MIRTKAYLSILALALAAPAVIQAQEPHAHHHMDMADHCPMLGAPGMVLMVQDELDLTPEQTARIEALHEQTQRMQAQLMERMSAVHQRAMALTEADTFDPAAADAIAQEAGQLHAERMRAMLEARHQTAQVLTSAQHERLGQLHREHHEHGHHHGMGMMMDCPMMHHHKDDHEGRPGH